MVGSSFSQFQQSYQCFPAILLFSLCASMFRDPNYVCFGDTLVNFFGSNNLIGKKQSELSQEMDFSGCHYLVLLRLNSNTALKWYHQIYRRMCMNQSEKNHAMGTGTSILKHL
ncbi:hypothetical protein K1719_043904 [Acacia pycnantha]|nr:hypothetical protein K1719_043904 [Acacia pycnantha]